MATAPARPGNSRSILGRLKGAFSRTSSVQDSSSAPPPNTLVSTTDMGQLAQAWPQSVQSQTTAPVGGSSAKEKLAPGLTLERPQIDQGSGLQMVEIEPSPELPPEVESYIQKVEHHPEQLPQEIVIADQQGIQPTTPYLAQPVVVLPITQDVEKEGQRKNSNYSVRWLVEWCWKLMKVFSGKIVYRSVAEQKSV